VNASVILGTRSNVYILLIFNQIILWKIKTTTQVQAKVLQITQTETITETTMKTTEMNELAMKIGTDKYIA